MYARSYRVNPILALLGIVLFIWLFVWLIRGAYDLLSMVTIPLLVATAILNYKILVSYLVGIRKDFENRPGLGIIKVLMTVFGLPFVSLWLFVKALAERKQRRMQAAMESEQRGEYAEFEEVYEFPPQHEQADLDLDKQQRKPAERILRPDQQAPEDINHYEKLFTSEK